MNGGGEERTDVLLDNCRLISGVMEMAEDDEGGKSSESRIERLGH